MTSNGVPIYHNNFGVTTEGAGAGTGAGANDVGTLGLADDDINDIL